TNGKRKGSDMTQQASRDIEPNVSEQDAKLRRARRRVAAIKGFYLHLLIFVLVMLGLSAINFAVGGPWWVLWGLLGWGVGLLAHAFDVFSHSSSGSRIGSSVSSTSSCQNAETAFCRTVVPRRPDWPIETYDHDGRLIGWRFS